MPRPPGGDQGAPWGLARSARRGAARLRLADRSDAARVGDRLLPARRIAAPAAATLAEPKTHTARRAAWVRPASRARTPPIGPGSSRRGRRGRPSRPRRATHGGRPAPATRPHPRPAGRRGDPVGRGRPRGSRGGGSRTRDRGRGGARAVPPRDRRTCRGRVAVAAGCRPGRAGRIFAAPSSCGAIWTRPMRSHACGS